VVFATASFGAVLLCRVVNPPFTPLTLIRMGEAWRSGRSIAIDRRWVPLERVSRALMRAVLAAEDARYFTHHGIDFVELRRAMADGPPQRGASTVTMQCARNVFLWQGRSYVRKALELYFAGLMELLWGKQRILEVYVNVIEWGDGIYGAEAAAQRYFDMSAAKLDPWRASLLAAVLPNPRRWNPASPTAYVRDRARMIRERAVTIDLASLDLS
jgi:monofunctional biosynthetic peptidoglycan transglycosylase